MGGFRERLISDLDRMIVVEMIDEARDNCARVRSAWDELSISERTYQRRQFCSALELYRLTVWDIAKEVLC